MGQGQGGVRRASRPAGTGVGPGQDRNGDPEPDGPLLHQAGSGLRGTGPMDRDSRASKESPLPRGQWAAQPEDTLEVGAPISLGPEIQVRFGELRWGGWEREQPERELGGWTFEGRRGAREAGWVQVKEAQR